MSLRSVQIRKWDRRERRAMRVRKKVRGTPEKPRLTVHRSHRHFHCQIVDDLNGKTLASASTLQGDLKKDAGNGGDQKAARLVGLRIAELAKEQGVSKVIFDRGFYRFHGRVRTFAEAAAEGGLDFLGDPEKLKVKAEKKKAKKGAGKKKEAPKGEGKKKKKKDKKKG